MSHRTKMVLFVIAALLLSGFVATHGISPMDRVDVCTMYKDVIPTTKQERQRIAIIRQGHGCEMTEIDMITRGLADAR